MKTTTKSNKFVHLDFLFFLLECYIDLKDSLLKYGKLMTDSLFLPNQTSFHNNCKKVDIPELVSFKWVNDMYGKFINSLSADFKNYQDSNYKLKYILSMTLRTIRFSRRYLHSQK